MKQNVAWSTILNCFNVLEQKKLIMLKFFLVTLVRIYQNSLSLIMPSSCRFTPSCSQYMVDSINKHGSFRGVILGIKKNFKVSSFFKT